MVGKATEIDLCPWAFLGDDLGQLNRIFDLLRHWRTGNLALIVPDPTEDLMDLVATADQQAHLWEAEMVAREQTKAAAGRK